MCKAPKAPKIEIPEAQVLSNPFLDANRNDTASIVASRNGRSALRIPLDTGLGVGFTPRSGGTGIPNTPGAAGNARRGPGLPGSATPNVNATPYRGNNPSNNGRTTSNLRLA